MDNNTDFIIFGSGNYHTLGIMHALHEANRKFFVLVVGDYKNWKDGNIVGHSRFWNNFYQVKTEQEGADWLLENMCSFPEGTIIFPTGDSFEKVLDQNYNKMYGHYIFPNAGKQGRVCEMMDKHFQAQIASEEGIRTLWDCRISKHTNLSQLDISFPCMLKPLNSITGSKSDMRLCKDLEELKRAVKESKHTEEFIIQQYIKNESDLLFLGISTPQGRVELLGLVRKPDVSPIGEYSYAYVTTDVASILPEMEDVKRFVKRLHYVGPFSVEFGVENGKNYLFEINLRNDGTSHYILNTGINLPDIFYRVMKGEDVDYNRVDCQYEMIDETGDLRRVLYKELSPWYWIKRLRNAGAFQFYHKDDKQIIPFIVFMVIRRSSDKIWRMLRR